MSDALFFSTEDHLELTAHRKPVSVATGEIKVWVRGDSQEGKRAGDGAELKIKGRRRVPFTI